MADLSVTIGGDSSEFDRELRDVERQLSTLERRREARVRIGADIGDLDRRISDVNTRLGQLRTNLTQTGNAAQNFNRQAANGSNTLTQFSRIAQDAPFGIMGIGNNLTATAEAFANLSRQSGGAGAALRAVGQSLLGSGGILLAVSLVTTALTVMSQKGLTVGDVFKMITGDFDKARRAMQELNVETVKNAQAQISTVGAYVSAAKNINLSMQDRLIAVKKLQDEYPAYFGNLTKEQILNGNVATTVREVTAALIAKAKAAGLTNRIVALAEEEEKIQNRINNQIADAARQAKLTNAQTKILAGNLKALAENGGDFLTTVDKVGREAHIPFLLLRGTIVGALQGFRDVGEELRANRAEQDRLTTSLEKQTAAQIKLEAVKEKASKKPNVTPQVSGVDNLINPSGLVDLTKFEQLNGKIDEFGNKVRELPGTIQSSLSKIPAYFDTSLQESLLLMQKFNADLDRLITDSLSSTLENLGDSIGKAFAEGKDVLSAIGKTLISAFGGFLSDMGSLLIKYGTLAIAKGVIDKALTSGNPVVTIAAGAAAIAVGVALKAAGGAISSTASGGGSSTSGSNNYSTGASYRSPSTSGGSGSSYSNSGTVVFEIAGTTLLGVLSNTIDSNKRLGGATGLNL